MKWYCFIVVIFVFSCGKRENNPSKSIEQTTEINTDKLKNYIDSTSQGESISLCDCESELFESICNPISQSSGNIFDNPESRTDTTFNEGPIYLYKTISINNPFSDNPVDTIRKSGIMVRCLKMAFIGEEGSEYYEKKMLIWYQQKLFWTNYYVYSTINEDLIEDRPHFTVHSYVYYFR